MSVHKSLRGGSALSRPRNVYTRAERVTILLKDGRLQPGNSVVGLPKTKVLKALVRTKKKAKDEA